MSNYLDLESWPRRPHFDFFRSYESPFWDVCTNVDVTALAARCRGQEGPSFAPAAIYFSLRAANAVENLRYRLRGDRVLVHERIHGSSTILRPNETFGFAYFDFKDDYPEFERNARQKIAEVKRGATLDEAGDGSDDLIYYSVLPWIHFTSFQHARRSDPGDSVPRIVFGRYRQYGERLLMPVSLSLHHALADGLHAGRFFENFENELAELRGLP